MSTSVNTDGSVSRTEMARALSAVPMLQFWDSIPDIALLVQRRTKIVAANPAACAELGYDLDSLLELDVEDLIPESRRVNHRQHMENYYSDLTHDGELRSEPMALRGGLECRRADGSTLPVVISLVPMRGSTDTVMLLISSIEKWLARELVVHTTTVAQEVAEERLRIARDVHDHSLQELISIGMLLRSWRHSLGADEVRHLNGAINSLEDTTKRIRNSIFNTAPVSREDEPLSVLIAKLVSKTRVRKGCEVSFTVSSGADADVPEFTREHVVAVTSEALSNAARHSSATRIDIDIDIDIDDDRVTVIVTDNGTGIPADLGPTSGLANMAARAQLCEGSFSHTDNPGGGTILHWNVLLYPNPLPRPGGGGETRG